MDYTAEFYSRPSTDFRGGGFPVFSGSRRQRGGNIFGSIKNFFLPIAKKLGRKLFTTGIGLATDIARDAMEGKSIKNALKERGKTYAKDFGKAAAAEGIGALTNMVGRGRRRARKRVKRAGKRKRKAVSRRPSRRHTSRKTPSRKRTSRKRHSRSKSTRKAKRRRLNF